MVIAGDDDRLRSRSTGVAKEKGINWRKNLTVTKQTSFQMYLWPGLILILLGLVVAVTYANYRYTQQNPGGNDFLVHWVGTRALLVDGVSPYSDEVANRIQTLAYGRPAQPGEHELRVAYPLYSEIIFAPFAIISDFNLARAVWMTALEIALVFLAFICLRLTGWQPGLWFLPFYFIFSIFWYNGLRALINGNAVILVALLIAGALLAIQAGRDELAGILLAFATIKPQVIIVFILFVCWWAFSVQREKIIIWMIASLVLLSLIAILFVPDWPLQNIREILRYPGYNPPGTPGAALATWFPAAGQKFGWGLTILLCLLLAGEWIAARGKDFHWFLWTVCLTLTASPWIGIQTDPGNFVVLFIPLVLVSAVWEQRWGKRGWPFVIIGLLTVWIGLWVLFLKTVTITAGQPLQSPIMFFPLPFFALIGLYWVRWWAIQPPKLLIDALRSSEEI
jgi:hypothetical protein